MKLQIRLQTFAATSLIIIYSLSNTYADGDIPPFEGAKQAGRAGVAAAFAEDGTSGNSNPALMATVGNIISFHPGCVFQNQTADYIVPSVRSFGPQKNKRDIIPGAFMGWNHEIKESRWTIGQSLTGFPALTKFPNNFIIPQGAAPAAILNNVPGSGPGNTYVYASEVRINNILALKLHEKLSLASSIILGYKRIQSNLLTSTGQVPTSFDKIDSAWGAGLKVGIHWKPLREIEIGLAVATPLFYQRLRKYTQLIAYCLNQPWNGVVGVAWHVTPKTTLGFDIEGELAKTVRYYDATPPLGVGWTTPINYKIGLQHKFLTNFIGRLGYNFGLPPIKNDSVYANIFAPIISKHMIATGFTYSLNQKLDIDFAVNYFFKNTLTDNGKNLPIAQGLKISAELMTFIVGFNYKY